jgi:MoxR-like ATPase
VVDASQLRAAQHWVANVYLADEVARYVVSVLHSIRQHPRIAVGPSTRAAVALSHFAKAVAAMDRRNYVTPHDVAVAASTTLAHRIAGQLGGRTHADALVASCLHSVPAPRC